MSTWLDHSRKVITEALDSGRELGLEGKALERHVQAAYPYGPRELWPYKKWCQAFNELVKGKVKGRAKSAPVEIPGQGKLF